MHCLPKIAHVKRVETASHNFDSIGEPPCPFVTCNVGGGRVAEIRGFKRVMSMCFHRDVRIEEPTTRGTRIHELTKGSTLVTQK